MGFGWGQVVARQLLRTFGALVGVDDTDQDELRRGVRQVAEDAEDVEVEAHGWMAMMEQQAGQLLHGQAAARGKWVVQGEDEVGG